LKGISHLDAMTGNRLGRWSASAVFLIGAAYLVTLTIGVANAAIVRRIAMDEEAGIIGGGSAMIGRSRPILMR